MRKRKMPEDKADNTVRNMAAEQGGGRKRRSVRSPSGRNVGAAFCLLLAACLVAGAACYAVRRRHPPERPPGLVYEANVVSGDIPGKSREERQRELDSMVEEGMLNMSMNITPSGKVSDGRMINWLIENPSNQGKLIRVEITRDDTGEKIYETGAIRPGSYVESAPLNVELSAGIYECTAVFLAYREETEALIGQAAVKVTLTLQE